MVDNLTVRHPSGLKKLAIDQEMFSGSVDTGFVLALPFHQGDLTVQEFQRGGAYAWD